MSYDSSHLKIKQLTKSTYLHTSYLATKSFGKVPCNGMVVLNDGEALVIDTPVDSIASVELLQWIQGNRKAKLKGVIATHFHVDCLGGLDVFHQREIPSYATNQTIALAKERNEIIPQNGFDQQLEINVGNKKVINEFIGSGHTIDNIISYFPSEKVLFGGCLIKTDGAGKGNLNDADVAAWSSTVKQVKAKYGEAQVIIPGHGKIGDVQLLDYTINLFE